MLAVPGFVCTNCGVIKLYSGSRHSPPDLHADNSPATARHWFASQTKFLLGVTAWILCRALGENEMLYGMEGNNTRDWPQSRSELSVNLSVIFPSHYAETYLLPSKKLSSQKLSTGADCLVGRFLLLVPSFILILNIYQQEKHWRVVK